MKERRQQPRTFEAIMDYRADESSYDRSVRSFRFNEVTRGEIFREIHGFQLPKEKVGVENAR